jgi:CheY-like chemotaxis protein
VKFLVVDDHSLLREGVRQVLESLGAGVTVLEARNAEEAFALVEQHPDLDLVLLDLGYPASTALPRWKNCTGATAVSPWSYYRARMTDPMSSPRSTWGPWASFRNRLRAR